MDLHEHSLAESQRLLRADGLDGTFIAEDFFKLSTPDKLDAGVPKVDAVIGNPPFIRYQHHAGLERKRAQRAALEQGVRLSGLASSWAALLVHACGFLKPEGRLAMVLPAELLSVGYAEPIRAWLKRRFKAVHLVMFDRLQFADALEKVVLVLARGSGGCNAFSLVPVGDATDLPKIRMFGPMHLTVAPTDDRKWTDFLLPVDQRQLFDHARAKGFASLADYGNPCLGTVTGNNDFFCISERTRASYGIGEEHLLRQCPPGTRNLAGAEFSFADWEALRDGEQPVWLVAPSDEGARTDGIADYLDEGIARGIPQGYKCRKRKLWFRPPAVQPPDFFFTYMAHWAPRLIANSARVTFVNSMHGVHLHEPNGVVKDALPFLALNSVTMLGGELFGRSYGGGVLKMEPREAAMLPVPSRDVLLKAWSRVKSHRAELDADLRAGRWTAVVATIDRELLVGTMRLSTDAAEALAAAAQRLREDRLGASRPSVGLTLNA